MLKIENVTGGYINIPVLKNISFEVGDGELVGLIGLNGSGKSTTINEVIGLLTPYQGKIALETMAGKGSELGKTFEEINYLISHCDYPEKLGVCLDTCHIHDAGYDLSNFDAILDEFDRIIDLDRLLVVHLNDSKNVQGAHKDRHANLGLGEIGFDILNGIAHNERIKDVPKILETPYIDHLYAPY